MGNNLSKKKIKEIPNVECEFKYGKTAHTEKIHEKGKDIEVVAFVNIEGLYPVFDEETKSIVFIDEDDDIIEFSKEDMVLSSDYEGSYHRGLSPLPSNNNSKYNATGAIRNGFEGEMEGVDTVFEIVKAMASYGFNKSHK